MNTTNILFYSKKCGNCKILFDFIIEANILEYFKTICIYL